MTTLFARRAYSASPQKRPDSSSVAPALAFLVLLAVIPFISSQAQEPGQQTYDAAADFSIANGNPNGAWTYGWSTTLTSPLHIYTSGSGDGGGNEEWFDPETVVLLSPRVLHNPTTVGNRFGAAGGCSFHPGPNGEFSHFVWTAPVSGNVAIDALFTPLDSGGTDVHVVVRGVDIFAGEVDASTSQAFRRILSVEAGDKINFAVGWGANGDFYSDTTGIAASVTYTTAPPANTLSRTLFSANGSTTPVLAADSIISFQASQLSNASQIGVRVQSSTTPDAEGSWLELADGNKGYMTREGSSDSYVLNSTSYPRVANLYFRVISDAPGFNDSVSSKIGPFNLSSSSQRLGPVVLSVFGGEHGARLNFRGFEPTILSGLTVRIQSTSTPGDEGSWLELEDDNSGNMQPFGGEGLFALDSFKYPAGTAIYFRAVAAADGYVDSFSRAVGPFTLINATPPTVTVNPPAGQTGSGNGSSVDQPILLNFGSFNLSASATAANGRQLKSLALVYDGATISRFAEGVRNGTTPFTTTVAGDHVIEAFATDDLGVIGDAVPVHVRVGPPGARIRFMISSGDWSNAANWRDLQGASGAPNVNDLAIVGASHAALSENHTAYAVSLNGGSITGPGDLTVTGHLSIAAGELRNLNVTITETGTLQLINDVDIRMAANLINYGTISITGTGGVLGTENGSAARATEGGERIDAFFDGFFSAIRNFGTTIFKRKKGGKTQRPPAAPPARVLTLRDFQNHGRLIATDGASLIGLDGASVISRDSAGFRDRVRLIANDGGTRRQARAARGAALAPAGEEREFGFTQTSGEMNLDGFSIEGPVFLEGGVLTGSGTIEGDLINSGGFISPGTLSITGNFAQTANGSLVLEVGGTVGNSPEASSDQLQIGGAAALGGNLTMKTINGFTPEVGAPLIPIGYAAATGKFATTSGNAQVILYKTGADVTVAGPNPPAPKALNIATRMRVATGENVLIAGFIVTGSEPKKVLIRGMGPSLENDGVAGALQDPVLDLDAGTITNDNWKSDQQAEIEASTIPPRDNREAAIVVTLEPGPHTAILSGAGGTTGVGLVEVYDLEAGTSAQLANISTRGLVQTGDNVMIGGFIIGGDYPAKVLLRALGPSLPVDGALQDPTLELVDPQGNIISNDDWRAAQEGEIAAILPPGNDREPALITTLVPGFYTAIVRGKEDATGVALVEAYNLQ